ncbi:MAG TPA: ABC transporter ATP-binding protein [Patescibacteria group bacterium]|nr:ABC transporter ATP-binding protein [Patescibacteria group bacterium]
MSTKTSEHHKKNVPLIQLKHLKKTYWNGKVAIPAVRDVNLTIYDGEFVALMGSSGSGKSTLLHMLAFLDAPTSGTYTFNGEDILEFQDDYLATLRNATIGFVFQQFYLLPRTTAIDNVRLALLYAGVKRTEQQKRAYAALCTVGLEERIYHRPNELSGGQQQRVSIARALVNNPSVIFCDEPTGNLDSKTAHEIMDILKKLHAGGKTIIMVTHDHTVARYAERIIHMKDGLISRT